MSTTSRARAMARRDRAQPASRTGASARSTRARRCAMPGVQAVLTAADIGPRRSRPSRSGGRTRRIAPYAQPVIADDVVRYVGEPVAVVLAEQRRSSPRMRPRRSRSRSSTLPPVTDWQASAQGRRAAVRRHDEPIARRVFTASDGRRRGGLPRRRLYAPRADSACSA